MKKILLGCALTMLSAAALAKDDMANHDIAIQLSPRIGYGEVQLESTKTQSGHRENLDALDLGFGVGVVMPFGVLVEGGVHRDYSESWVDNKDRFELDNESLAIGYQFETDRGVRLIPKVGRTHWRLKDKGGVLSDAGPDGDHRFDGYDYFWELTLQKRVSRVVSLGVTVKDNEFDFGNARAINFTATFDL